MLSFAQHDNGTGVSARVKAVTQTSARTVDLLTGEYSSSGVYFNITAPGFGPVYLVVGHEVFDGDGNVLQYVGPEIVDIPALCAAMAP